MLGFHPLPLDPFSLGLFPVNSRSHPPAHCSSPQYGHPWLRARLALSFPSLADSCLRGFWTLALFPVWASRNSWPQTSPYSGLSLHVLKLREALPDQLIPGSSPRHPPAYPLLLCPHVTLKLSCLLIIHICTTRPLTSIYTPPKNRNLAWVMLCYLQNTQYLA